MKLTFVTLTENAIAERDYCDLYAIEIDDKKVFSVADGEPEDNNLSRNFNDVYKLKELLLTMYQAGADSEKLEINDTEVEDY